MNFELHAMSYARGKSERHVRNFVYASCGGCRQPVSFELSDAGGTGRLGPDFAQYPATIEQLGWRIVNVWPDAPKPIVPDHVPDAVAKAYLSAERTFAMAKMEETSAAAYGRALDIGTKLYAADLAGESLYNRIRKLSEQHRITADLAAWAHAIRLIRNGALHEVESITRDELIAIRGFSETVLTYLFTLPGMLKARQALTKEKPRG